MVTSCALQLGDIAKRKGPKVLSKIILSKIVVALRLGSLNTLRLAVPSPIQASSTFSGLSLVLKKETGCPKAYCLCLRYTPLVEVNQAIISLVVLDNLKQSIGIW